jgi:hypothetical protein
MQGFGNLKQIEELKKCIESIEDEEIMEPEMSSDDQSELENVVVPTIEKDVYEPVKKEEKKSDAGSGNKEVLPSDEKKTGAAGNAEVKEEVPIMGGLGMGSGIGGGLKKEMSRMEGFTPNEVVDEEPMAAAKDVCNANVIDKVKDIFDKIYDNKFNKAKQKQYDLDSTKPKMMIGTEPIKHIPKGW